MSANILELHNKHELDANIKFYREGHKYEVTTDNGSQYTSVTTWVHTHFPRFNPTKVIADMMKSKNWGPGHKYWGQTADEIKNLWKQGGLEASVAGTKLHANIETFMNNMFLCQNYTHKDLLESYTADTASGESPKEWLHFIKFIQDHQEMKPYRTEWMVYHDELKISGSIDMVYENPDGTLSIYDWKRSKDIVKTNDWNKTATHPLLKHIPDTNFWHYTLQLNTYKLILEERYNKKVTKLCLVRLHPDCAEDTYELLDVPIMEELMASLVASRRRVP